MLKRKSNYKPKSNMGNGPKNGILKKNIPNLKKEGYTKKQAQSIVRYLKRK